ncbi:xylose isomerase-like protein [Sistotremastrum suecicum HHB10207 ss-3]|uniref:Xylose isomerase-like protein n=1 Tax=Sistotremastrum suecicum HHB10207 ss-3 TaxID=1314776 RepID=A0A166D8A8_9AGAM|nr:xylose isomerase-like protein [Sistotremastrum suecicum HHB10207 ss-3]
MAQPTLSDSLDNIQTCYASPSAGMHPSHTLPKKLRAIADAGFKLAEVALPDLEALATSMDATYKKIDENGDGDIETLIKAAEGIAKLARDLDLEIFVLHPFSQFEGHQDPAKRSAAFNRAKTWFRIVKALKCTMIQVGSSNDRNITSDFRTMADDLQELADLGAQEDPPLRFAYEMWAWGTHVNTWKHTWEICKLVNRPNFGLCLDTFQIAAREYADPTASMGLSSKSSKFHESLEELSLTIKPAQIFYFQISDGSRVDPDELHSDAEKAGIPPLYEWSNKWRPLPYGPPERKGYLPVVDVVEAVLRTGWRGPWSYEVFYAADQAKDDPDVPAKWTQEAQECHKKLLDEVRRRLAESGP